MQISANLITLCRHYWNIPVLAELYEAEGGFVDLIARLALSRDSLSRSLGHLRSARWIGRPQGRLYRITPAGARIAPHCREILDLADDEPMRDLALRRWTLPIVSALHNWDVQFNQLKTMLPDISPRALTLALKDMQSAGLLEREILPTFPPTPVYRLTSRGVKFLRAIPEM